VRMITEFLLSVLAPCEQLKINTWISTMFLELYNWSRGRWCHYNSNKWPFRQCLWARSSSHDLEIFTGRFKTDGKDQLSFR
jgi:hypothetical protein